jgi:hypothetical protein
MERHLSTGVSTIVALMAAHRVASGRERSTAVYSQDEIARIVAYLHENELARPAAAVAPNRRRARRTGCIQPSERRSRRLPSA